MPQPLHIPHGTSPSSTAQHLRPPPTTVANRAHTHVSTCERRRRQHGNATSPVPAAQQSPADATTTHHHHHKTQRRPPTYKDDRPRTKTTPLARQQYACVRKRPPTYGNDTPTNENEDGRPRMTTNTRIRR
ncbi:hypothetical protein K443DRAFT_13720 [Laccaria amethystina LaAM-08-1]|uniref:Uncharacterized protein n=1 Tax=Laccaria amethystina LaAM-08-1 TaxID=1095629 RepID=A0A0C9WNU0_9AGAR|nr:hypothetical protein K443DRAFT_13720 [Laccaria amethystina LaAM-08-1]